VRSSRSRTTTQPSELWVGDYRLLAKIGEGGMGVVHLAQGRDGRRVALKILRPHIIGDDEARERLAREVASLRRVRSPRIAEVIDADPWGEIPFVATRYVPGLSLHQHAREEGPIAGQDLQWFAAGLAEAVSAVHAVGVLHRDIKPSNVLLEGRSPVLIDFGLARLADDPRLTVTGWLLGTPGYLAPEILYGDDATTASDVHSWAATVVFAATGRPPFGQGPAVAIMDRVRRGEHDLSGVPADLAPLLRACLDPEPAARPGLPRVLAELRPGRRRGRPGPEPATMPFALAVAHDDDPTDVLQTDQHTAQLEPVQDVAQTLVQKLAPRTGPLHDPLHNPPTTPLTAVQTAARTPYQQPAAPEASPLWRPPPSGPARICRGAILAGLFLLVAAGFAAAPYLSLGALSLTTLALRTWSWTSEAAADRAWRRGRRWYDGPLAALSAPWYLLVATGGTLMLVVWSAALAFLVGAGLLLFRAPSEAGLLVMGAVLAFSLWWGPGSRRLRVPSRAVVLRLSLRTWLGWLSATVVATLVAGCFYALGDGVSWDPQPGPPWRNGTLLGDLARFL
jgi:serine/threonine protein kinase